MNYLQDLLNLTEEKLTRAKFVSISLGLAFVYIILASIGNVLGRVLILGVGDLCTLLGFNIILLFSVRADLRLKLVKYVKDQILDNEKS
jgi:hypothetical protein